MSVDRSQLPVPGHDRAFRFPHVERTTLESGLRVWTVERRDVPVLALLLVVPTGSVDDPPDRPGLASLTADLLDEGSGDRTAVDMHDALARIGAQFDTEASCDATLVTLVTLSRFRDEGLRLAADIVFRPRLGLADFERVRELRRNRLAQLRDVPGAVAERVFAEQVFGAHPYGHLPVGTEAALAAVTLDEVQAFHRAQYRLDHTVLIAVGDASASDVVASVRAAFDEVPCASAVAGRDPGASMKVPPAERRLVTVHRPGAPQSELRIGRVAASRYTTDYYALTVLNTVLGGQFVSRINLNLREDKGYTYGARSSFDFRRQHGPFVVQASVQTDATADAVREVFRELDDIGSTRPASERELVLARAALTRGYPRNFETAEQVARAIAQLALYGLPDDYFDSFVDRVRTVGIDEVTDAARRYLPAAGMLAVVVGDCDRVATPLEGLGFAQVAMATVE